MILIATQTFAPIRGGMEIYMTSLAGKLAEAGLKVVVLADGSDKSFSPSEPYTLKRFGGWRPLRRWKKRFAVRALLAKGKIDGVFCDSWKSVESLPQKLPAPIVILAHGAEYPVAPSTRKQRRIASALARSTAILANSKYTAELVRPFLSRPNDPRLKIVHPPISFLPDASSAAQEEINRIIAERSPVISVVARLEARKGIDRVIAALPDVAAKHPSAFFLIGGSGGDKDRLAALAREKGVGDRVVFLGSLDNDMKAALLAASDVFAMPVRRVGMSVEGFGASYAEAGWFGVPSLGGKGSGAEDAVIDEKTGLLCDGENQTEVTAKLLRLLGDDNFRHTLGRAAEARTKAELVWDVVLPRFLAAMEGR
jgi:phosphatidylinositol alpha-1,6-mannosyltransferase